MFKELLSAVKEFIIRFISSRLFALGLIFTLLFAVLAGRLFELQIVNGDQYLSDYQNRTLTKVTTVGTRGNIYDRDGRLLAYNELQYNITIADNGAYDTTDQGINRRNLMLYHLTEIIEKYAIPSTDSIRSGSMRIMSFSSRRAPKMTGSALSRTSAGAMSPT